MEDGAPFDFQQPPESSAVSDALEDGLEDGARLQMWENLQVAIVRFLAMLDAVGDPLLVGRTVKILNFLTGHSGLKTKVELARQLEVTPARISQLLKAIPADFKSLTYMRNRSRKAEKFKLRSG